MSDENEVISGADHRHEVALIKIASRFETLDASVIRLADALRNDVARKADLDILQHEVESLKELVGSKMDALQLDIDAQREGLTWLTRLGYGLMAAFIFGIAKMTLGTKI